MDVDKHFIPQERIVNISVKKWCEYTKSGIMLPISTVLHGHSMEPLIRYKRDVVTIIPASKNLLVGDVVLFERHDGAHVVHRIFKIDGNTVQTWGDNCSSPDRAVSISNIRGVVISVKKGKHLIILDSDKQRASGVAWMNGGIRRKIWFSYRFFRTTVGKMTRRAMQICSKR